MLEFAKVPEKTTWTRGATLRRRGFALLLVLLAQCGVVERAHANVNGTWSNAGVTTVNGVSVTLSGTGLTGMSGFVSPGVPHTLDATDYWSNPYSGGTMNSKPSLRFTIPTTGSTITVTFSKPVDNPVLHFDRFGGSVGTTSNSSSWTLSSSVASSAVTLNRLAGVPHFTLSGSTFQATPNVTVPASSSTECFPTLAQGTGCGSIRFNGTNITSLTFAVSIVGPSGQDAVEVAVSLPETNVIIRKQTVDVTAGPFAFAGTNGVGSPTLNTTTTNPISSTSFSVTNHANPITIAETVPAGYRSDSMVCLNEAGGTIATTATGTVTTTSGVSIAAAAYEGGGQTITCTFVNKSRSDMSVNLAGLGPATLNVPYTGTYTCTNAGSPYLQADAATCAISGLPAGLTSTCAPVPPQNRAPGAAFTCTVSGTPTAAGTVTVTGTTGATNDLNLPNNTATAAFEVRSADMTPNLSGLPGTAILGVPYSGTVLCTNNAGATATAANATCTISGLPAGVTVGTCTPAPPTTVAPGASISCPVSGTPTASGAVTVTATTGAVNDSVGGVTAGGNNTATKPVDVTQSDMSINLSGLPTSASIGVPYSGTFTCSNAASPSVTALSASCSVAGLPAGLTTSCSPSPPTSVAPSGIITCTVSGTPTAVGTSNLTGTTGATNDGVPANNTALASITTTGSDMTPNVSGLPTTATVGVPYSGTVLCTNNAGATAAASNATCAISGLPAGVTVGTCTPTPPATVAAGSSISCPVSGIPTTPGAVTVTVATGATNDTDGGATAGGNNTTTAAVTTSGSDMSIDLSGLPMGGGIGQPYSGTYTCTNATSPAIAATAASCAISGLPAGLTSSCSPAPPTAVAVGASITCTVSGTPTASGTSTLNGSTGATNDPNTANNTATTSLAIVAPSMSVVKSSTTTSFSAVGVVIPYTFAVTNNGTVTITAPITVSDSKIASVSCPGLPVGGLLPTQSITCSGSYTTTQADLDAGGVTNNASASSGTTTSPSVSHNVPATQTPSLSVTKGTTTTNFNAVGVSVPYTFLVRNTGNVTLTSAVTVSDSKIASVSCPPLPGGVLAPNATITCTGTYTTTQADLDAGSVVNTATASSGATTSGPGSHTLPAVQTPALSIVKATVASNYNAVGVSIPYTFQVTNSGNVTITSAITVSDNKIASVSCPPLPGGVLAPLASITCSGTYTTTQADIDAGSIVNAASATSGTTTSNTASHTLNAVQMPALTVQKTSTTTAITTVGQVVPYSYRVANSGNVTLTSAITVSDNKIASVSCPPLPGGQLAPLAFITCSGSYTVTQIDLDAGGVTNIASAASGTTTSPGATLTVPATQSPALTILKSSTTASFSAVGVSIPYSFRVTNSGNVTLTSAITVSDNKIASVSCPALPGGILAPGSFITCSGTYTTTQADIDAGGVTNTASASSGPTTSLTTNLTVPATQTRSYSIAKTASPTTFSATGVAITYTYVVRNTGNVTVMPPTTISVSDNKIASVSCPAIPVTGLAPNATLSCSATATTTQADLDAGSIVNTASATDGTTTSPTTSATVTATQTPGLTVTKSTTTTSFSAVGVVVPYSFLVRNSGNVTITSPVTVSDDKISSVSCPALPGGLLSPNATITCTGSYTTTQSDLDAGSVVNLASASSGTTTSPTVTHTLPANQTRSLSVAKSASPTTFSAVGATINYSYVVRNTGNITISASATISVSDNKIASVSCPVIPVGGLAPNATLTCTASATTTQADLDAGSITNTATATDGTVTSAIATATVTATQTPALTVLKSTTATGYSAVGTVIPYSFRVTNSGNITLTSAITVSDNKVASVNCPALPGGILAPGGFITCTGSYTVVQSDLDAGSIVNTASAQSGTTTSSPASHTLNGTQSPALTIAKSTTTTSFSAVGVLIPYNYRVTNSGNVTLTTAITVSDNKIASVSCPPLPGGVLAPGAFINCTGTYTTTQADIDANGVTNTASATSGTTTSPSVAVTVPSVKTPAMTVLKTSTTTSYVTVGQSIPYSYRVTNSGNTTLTSAITITDNKIPGVSCPALPGGILAPGAFITCSGTYTVTQADIDAGGITNTASSASGTTTSPQTDLTIPAVQSPALTVLKSSTMTSFATVGTVIPYSYRVTNSGNTTLTSAITVSDNKIASVSCPALPGGILAPGGFITCSGSYTVTQTDLNTGSLSNAASASSGPTTSPTVNLTIPATQTPSLAVVKSTTATSYTTVGTIIPYNFAVTNNGNITLTNAVTVSDSKIASVSCPALPGGGLIPGASITCTGSYTIVQADIDGGNVLNTASATSGTVTSPTVTHTLNGTQTRQFTIAKSSTTATITAAGQVVPYSYLLTNSGNVTLTVNATVSDNKIAGVSCPAMPGAGLLPGASITCSASYTVTQADVDSGNVVNTASATSGTPTQTVTSNTTSLTIPVTKSPAMTVVKATTATTYSAVGAVIPYTFTVRNTGNTTLTSAITVSDSKIASVTCPALPGGGLAPNATHVCTGSYTITQTDLDAGSVVNNASATSGTTVSPTTMHTLPATQTRSLAMTKAASPTGYNVAGSVIAYTYIVRNTGNVTIPSTSPISVSDNKIASVSCPALPPAGLAPNATLTCTGNYTITQSDVDAGSVTNTATATDGVATSPIATATVTATQTPALTVTKSTTTTSFAAVGVSVPYTFVVRNSGNVTITNPVTVSDNKIASVSCPALPPLGLAPNATITCSGSYTTTQTDLDAGNVVNMASATSGTITSATVTHTLPAAQTRALSITKAPSPTSYSAPGVAVSYTYVVRNTGNITIPASATISISDNKIASVSCPVIPVGGLAPNATLTCSANYTTTQADVDAGSVTNTASATDGTVVSPIVSATITATQTPSLAVVKATTSTTYSAVGAVVPYTFRVTNNGNTTVTQPITVSDTKIASVSCPALPVAGLAPTQFITCTGSYTITQTDLDAGTVVNTASATSGTLTSPPVTHTLTATQSPALTLLKSSTTTNFSAPGVVVPYSYRVTNSGNTTLTNPVTVSDNKIASVSCPALPPGGLAPGAFVTCSASYTTTQADVDAGGVTNIASAASGAITSPTSTVTVASTRTPALTVVKASTTTSFNAAGVVVPYTYTVRNSGNTTITAPITVSDNKIASVSCPALPPGGLAPNATITCSGSYTTTQADVNAGGVTNAASATSGTTTSPTVNLTVPSVQTPALSILKSTTTASFNVTGAVIPFTYVVTNSGNTTLTSPITVSDNKIASVSCPALPPGGLIPTASITCSGSYVTTQADIDAGNVTNIASATSGTVTSPTATVTVNAVNTRALTVVKSSTTTSFSVPGVVVPYSYRVTNSGNTTLTSVVTISDNKIPSVSCPALPPGGLAPNAFITCTGSYTTTQTDVDAGGVTNSATATSGTTTSPSVSVTVPSTQTPALTLLKSSTTSTVAAAGTVVPYSYRVTNAGNTTLLAAITVSDNKIAAVSCPALPPGGLLPGAFITCAAIYTITQQDIDAGGVTNIASATSGAITSPTSTVTVTATRTPALTIAKSSTTTNFNAVGVVIPYSYRVTNSGNTTLTAPVTVTDNKIAAVSCPALPPGGLAPNAFITCSGSYTTSQADVDAGGVTNTASAASGTVTSPSVSVTIVSTRTPALTVLKSSTTTTFSTAGTVVPYTFRVTNSGNTTLTTAITVADNKIASVSCPALPPGGLAPAAFITCTGNYTVTQTDVDAGGVTNTASASSGTVTSPTVTYTVTATQSPALTVLKSTTTTAFATAGTVIPYSYRVTNSGNTTLLSAITVSDNKIASVSCPALPPGGLAPAAFITCTGNYTVTQADIDSGSIANTASATSGPITSPTVTVTVTATQTPGLTVVKSSTTTSFNVVGTVIPYSYRVTNSGNTTLINPVTVADNKIASVTCPALPVGGLAPAAFIICSGSYTTTQADVDAGSVVNTASATSGTVTSPIVTLSISATQTPALTVLKTSPVTNFNAAGAVIAYSYRVTNTGNVTLTTAVTVTDNKIASVTCPALPPGGLVPAAFITCAGSYTTTQTDVDAGGVTNTASAKSGTVTSPTTSLTISSTQAPALSVVKTSTATNYATVGQLIPYSYVVRNIGNVTLTTAISVSDNKIPAVSCPALPTGGLLPNATITCTGTYSVTQADINAGTLTNVATAVSGAVTSAPATLTLNAVQTPNYTIQKQALTATATPNSDGSYTQRFRVTLQNTGNVDLSDVVVFDDYQSQIPSGATVTGAVMGTVTSNSRGGLTTGNSGYTATTIDPRLLLGAGETLAVGEVISIEFDIVLLPGSNAPGPAFQNMVTASTVFNAGTPLEAVVTKDGSAPVMFSAPGALSVTKTTPKSDVTVGELVPYTITIRNSVTFPQTAMTIADIMPAGFKYLDGSATIDGVPREPLKAGRELTWLGVTVPGNGTVVVKLILVVGAGVGSGEFTNDAFVRNSAGVVVSNVGKATVRMVGDPTFDCTDIIGKVFDDKNQDGAQDDNERGIANVRLATVRGQLVTTDSEGRYHIACADIPESDRGTNFILKLDERTLPTGYRMTTENPRVIRITKGKMAKINFGASALRVARLDLTDGAFEPGATRLKPQWSLGMNDVLAALKKEKSVLRIGYRRGAQENAQLADQRIKAVEAIIRDLWSQSGDAYKLTIEAEVYFERRVGR